MASTGCISFILLEHMMLITLDKTTLSSSVAKGARKFISIPPTYKMSSNISLLARLQVIVHRGIAIRKDTPAIIKDS